MALICFIDDLIYTAYLIFVAKTAVVNGSTQKGDTGMKHVKWHLVISFIGILFNCQLATATQTVTFSGKPLNLNQGTIQLGQTVPTVDLVNADLNNMRVGGISNKSQVIATVISLDTPVCQAEIKRLDRLARKLPHIQFTVVANVSPFQLANFVRHHNVNHLNLVSNFRTPQFDMIYGTRIVDSKLANLNTRAIFVLDSEGRLVYQQFANELNRPPNYKSLRLALQSANTVHQRRRHV